jgi:hypothetical protein
MKTQLKISRDTTAILKSMEYVLILFIVLTSCTHKDPTSVHRKLMAEQDKQIRSYTWPDVGELPVIAELPDPLKMYDGRTVSSVKQWREERRPELISLFQHYMYGFPPPPPENFSFTLDYEDQSKYGGKATLKLITLRFGPEGTPPVSLMALIPNNRKGPAPVFIGLNFTGNHTTADFPEIPLTEAWVRNEWTGATDSQGPR